MKRLILILLILIITPFFVTSEITLIEKVQEIERSNKKKPELANWDYIKNRLFDGETSIFKKLKGPILIECRENTTKEDSLLIKEVLKDIRKIIPNKKFEFFNDYTGMSVSEMIQKGYKHKDSIKKFTVSEIYDSRISLDFEPGSLYRNPNYDFMQLSFGYSIQSSSNIKFNSTIISDPYMIVSMGEIFSFEDKKNYLKAAILRKLVFIQKDSYVKGRSIFATKEISGLDHFILDRDIFLLQKLYADDFLNQFKSYLYNNYPWRYAYSYLNKGKMKILAISTVALVGVLVFILLFSYFQNRRFKYAFFDYFFPITLIMLFTINLNWIYNHLATINTFVGWKENIIFGWSVGLLFSLITSSLLFLFERVFITKNTHFTIRLSLKIVFTFIVLHLPILISIFYVKDTGESLINVRFIDFYLPWFLLTIFFALGRGLLMYLNHFSDSLVKQKDVELSKLKELHSKAEMKLLQSQINPHFLYNSLNSIASLAPIDAKKTQQMAHSLSDLFKYSINRKGKENSTIKDEIEMVKTYLEIEKIRFGEHLQFTIDVDAALENKKIPLFLIQPLVENAIKHGVSKNVEKGKITIKVEKLQEEITISVADNGPNFPEGLISGHGLQTVYDLLRLNYKNNASLNWTNHPKKKITITILDKK